MTQPLADRLADDDVGQAAALAAAAEAKDARARALQERIRTITPAQAKSVLDFMTGYEPLGTERALDLFAPADDPGGYPPDAEGEPTRLGAGGAR
jgi:hypothetical protein